MPYKIVAKILKVYHIYLQNMMYSQYILHNISKKYYNKSRIALYFMNFNKLFNETNSHI